MSYADITPPRSQHSLEWGIASMFMGATLAVLAMMMLVLDLNLFLSPQNWGPSDLRLLHRAALAGLVVLGGLSSLSVLFGVCGLASAYRHGQASAFGWAGVLMSLLALALWLGAIADLFAVVDTMMRRQGLPGIF